MPMVCEVSRAVLQLQRGFLPSVDLEVSDAISQESLPELCPVDIFLVWSIPQKPLCDTYLAKTLLVCFLAMLGSPARIFTTFQIQKQTSFIFSKTFSISSSTSRFGILKILYPSSLK